MKSFYSKLVEKVAIKKLLRVENHHNYAKWRLKYKI